MDNENIVNSIKRVCKENNITVGQLEKSIGLSQGLVSKWINTNPSLDKVVDIADYFHISLDEVIGRDENDINDDFLNVLYKKTSNNDIQWKSFDKASDEFGLKQFSYDFGYDNFWSKEDYIDFEESHKQISYYFEYNHGYISIYALYSYHDITNPDELKLFIQPDIKAELIPQTYDYNELLPLWLKILTSLDDNTPDEIKAEDLKNDFIRGFDFQNKPKLKKTYNTSTKEKDDTISLNRKTLQTNTIKPVSLSEKVVIPKTLQEKANE